MAKQFENGFHLRMLLNHANITTEESRFLSNIIIWEWLYPHLKNPAGATLKDEEGDLDKIIKSVLEYYWPGLLGTALKNKKPYTIFYVLRNQLAHSGKIPINRSYAESWMTGLGAETEGINVGIKHYVSFFDKLTQVIVLKTLGIDAENLILSCLDQFLSTGRL